VVISAYVPCVSIIRLHNYTLDTSCTVTLIILDVGYHLCRRLFLRSPQVTFSVTSVRPGVVIPPQSCRRHQPTVARSWGAATRSTVCRRPTTTTAGGTRRQRLARASEYFRGESASPWLSTLSVQDPATRQWPSLVTAATSVD